MTEIKGWYDLSLSELLAATMNYDLRPDSRDPQNLLNQLHQAKKQAETEGLEEQYSLALAHLQNLLHPPIT